MNPALRPGLAVVWRDDTSIQLGIRADLAMVLRPAGEPEMRALALLDGSLDLDRVAVAAASTGLAADSTHALVRLLDAHGLLVWRPKPGTDAARSRHEMQEQARTAPDRTSLGLARPGDEDAAYAARRAAWVEVVGAGRVGAAVAETLAAAGIGTVTVVDEEPVTWHDVAPLGAHTANLGERRSLGIRDRIAELPASTRTRAPLAGDPTLTVLAPDTGPDALLAHTWARSGLPHLPAYVREHVGYVGPLVLPGHSTCLRCIDLHRTDRDPAWPRVASQLGRPGVTVLACDVVLATLIAAQAALQVLGYVEGRAPPTPPTPPPPTSLPRHELVGAHDEVAHSPDDAALVASLDAVLETELPDAVTVRRPWHPHPRCGCGAAAARLAAALGPT